MGKGGPKFKFTELRVWQKGKDLAVYIYRITNTGDFAKDYGLRDIQKETFKKIEQRNDVQKCQVCSQIQN